MSLIWQDDCKPALESGDLCLVLPLGDSRRPTIGVYQGRNVDAHSGYDRWAIVFVNDGLSGHFIEVDCSRVYPMPKTEHDR